MSSICLFASYVKEKGLPFFTEVYLIELKKQCETIIYNHSNELDDRAINFFKEHNITSKLTANEGYDFGQWKKNLESIDIRQYDRLYLINDSCILFASLEPVINWFNQSQYHFGGLTESNFDKKHLQTYFLMFNKNTFTDVIHFFKTTPTAKTIFEVIENFEIGISQFLLSKQYTLGAFLSNDGYSGEYAPYFKCVESHIKQGSPMIKKKIMYSSYRADELFTLARMNFDINKFSYIKLIEAQAISKLFPINDLCNNTSSSLTRFEIIKYNITRLLIQIYRKFKRDKS